MFCATADRDSCWLLNGLKLHAQVQKPILHFEQTHLIYFKYLYPTLQGVYVGLKSSCDKTNENSPNKIVLKKQPGLKLELQF